MSRFAFPLPPSPFPFLTFCLAFAFASSALALDAPKGAARRWEAALPVGLYGQVNLRTGRVLTTIPITGWSGRGPSIAFALYHNQNSTWGPIGIVPGDGDLDNQLTEGDVDPMLDILLTPPEEQTPLDLAIGDFDASGAVDVTDLGEFLDALEGGGGAAAASGGGPVEPCTPDWRHSYSAKVELGGSGALLTRDDGTTDMFTWDNTDPNGERLNPPPGVFDTMYYDYANDGFTLVNKNQWKAYFQWNVATPDWYRLEWIADAAVLPCSPSPCTGAPANKVICHYDEEINNIFTYGKLLSVEDATRTGNPLAGRKLLFAYTSLGRLKEITDPINRHWKLLYEVSSDPNNPTQDGTGSLRAVEDPMTYRTTVTYNGTCDIASVADKNGDAYAFAYLNGRLMTINDPAPFNAQFQAFSFYKIQFTTDQFAEYRDRRGELWHAMFSTVTGNIMEVEDPLGHTQTLEYDDLIVHPTMHDAITYRDALNHPWTCGWDTRGNLLTVNDPLTHLTQYGYDAINNLTSVTDAENIQTQAIYAVSSDPTKPSSIVIPADGHGNPATTIELTYYYDIDHHSREYGKLATVTDPRGVLARWYYDLYGQESSYVEGPMGDTRFWSVGKIATKDAAGRLQVGFNSESPVVMIKPSGNENELLVYCLPFADQGNCQDPNLVGPPSLDCCCDCVLHCLPGYIWPNPLDFVNVCWRPNNAGPMCSGSQQGAPPPQTPSPVTAYSPPKACNNAYLDSMLPTGPASYEYDQMQRLTSVDTGPNCYTWGSDPYSCAETTSVSATISYDTLGRPTSLSRQTNEPDWTKPTFDPLTNVTRSFSYASDLTQGTFQRTGPDNQSTSVTTDSAGRTTHVGRASLSADTTYYDNDSVHTVTYGNGTRTIYEYDIANRLTKIRHEKFTGEVILQQVFTMTPSGLIDTVAETGPDYSATVLYGYDLRGRLISERRQGWAEYWYTYTYDQSGNRTTKTQKHPTTSAVVEQTIYHYDLEDPPYYGSWNNRLMYYERKDANQVLLETTWYSYFRETGNPRWVIKKAADSPVYQGTQFGYTKSGEVRIVAKNQWQLVNGACANVTVETLSELRGSGRARYMKRQRNLNLPDAPVIPNSALWTDYDGDTPYGDFLWDDQSNELTNIITYLPGIGYHEGEYDYYTHSDQIGSTRVVTSIGGTTVVRFAYTAFGESVPTGDPATYTRLTRYRYGGDWGYESLTETDYLHVGYRYYDPSTGRFLQRDPIGIDGGLNTYGYVENNPITDVDSLGLDRYIVDNGGHLELLVTNPCGGYISGDFGSDSWYARGGWRGLWWDKGRVVISTQLVLGGKLLIHIKSTPAQDKQLIDWMRNQKANPPTYSLLMYNCDDWCTNGVIIGMQRDKVVKRGGW